MHINHPQILSNTSVNHIVNHCHLNLFCSLGSLSGLRTGIVYAKMQQQSITGLKFEMLEHKMQPPKDLDRNHGLCFSRIILQGKLCTTSSPSTGKMVSCRGLPKAAFSSSLVVFIKGAKEHTLHCFDRSLFSPWNYPNQNGLAVVQQAGRWW